MLIEKYMQDRRHRYIVMEWTQVLTNKVFVHVPLQLQMNFDNVLQQHPFLKNHVKD